MALTIKNEETERLARELAKLTGETLTAAIKRFGHKDARYIGALENAAPALRDHVQSGDLVLTLGAGTVNRVSEQLLGLLSEQNQVKAVQK